MSGHNAGVGPRWTAFCARIPTVAYPFIMPRLIAVQKNWMFKII